MSLKQKYCFELFFVSTNEPKRNQEQSMKRYTFGRTISFSVLRRLLDQRAVTEKNPPREEKWLLPNAMTNNNNNIVFCLFCLFFFVCPSHEECSTSSDYNFLLSLNVFCLTTTRNVYTYSLMPSWGEEKWRRMSRSVEATSKHGEIHLRKKLSVFASITNLRRINGLKSLQKYIANEEKLSIL